MYLDDRHLAFTSFDFFKPLDFSFAYAEIPEDRIEERIIGFYAQNPFQAFSSVQKPRGGGILAQS
jgi:hypothetical protein